MFNVCINVRYQGKYIIVETSNIVNNYEHSVVGGIYVYNPIDECYITIGQG